MGKDKFSKEGRQIEPSRDDITHDDNATQIDPSNAQNSSMFHTMMPQNDQVSHEIPQGASTSKVNPKDATMSDLMNLLNYQFSVMNDMNARLAKTQSQITDTQFQVARLLTDKELKARSSEVHVNNANNNNQGNSNGIQASSSPQVQFLPNGNVNPHPVRDDGVLGNDTRANPMSSTHVEPHYNPLKENVISNPIPINQINPPEFNGDKTQARHWLKKYDDIMNINGYNDEQKLKRAYSYMTGEAHDFFMVTTWKEPQLDWYTFTNRFISYFCGFDGRNQLRKKLENSRQKPKEHPNTYLMRVIRLCLEYDTHMSERDMIRRFINGLSELTQNILVASKPNIDDWTIQWLQSVFESSVIIDDNLRRPFYDDDKQHKPRIPIDNPMNRNEFIDPSRPKPGVLSSESVRFMKKLIYRNQQANKRRLDATLSPSSFKEGDLVLVERPERIIGTSEKLTFTYVGPYKIRRKISDLSFEIANIKGYSGVSVIHPYHLRRFIPRPDQIVDPLIEPGFVPKEQVIPPDPEPQTSDPIDRTTQSEKPCDQSRDPLMNSIPHTQSNISDQPMSDQQVNDKPTNDESVTIQPNDRPPSQSVIVSCDQITNETSAQALSTRVEAPDTLVSMPGSDHNAQSIQSQSTISALEFDIDDSPPILELYPGLDSDESSPAFEPLSPTRSSELLGPPVLQPHDATSEHSLTL